MSRSQALAEARRLKTIVESYGIECRIELMQGRPHSHRWWTRKYLLMSHDTVGSMRGNTPSLSVVKYGRPGLPGPLCNAYMGRDLVFRIITMGLGNHPGRGGPLTRDGVTLPRNSARIGSFGIEYEHDGVSEWPDGLREAMARANAAVLDWMDRPTTSAIEHATWTPRKIDRSPDYSRSGSTGQREIAAVRGQTEEDDDMTPAEREALAKRAGEWAAHLVWMHQLESPENGKRYRAYQYLLSTYERVGWPALRRGIEGIVRREGLAKSFKSFSDRQRSTVSATLYRMAAQVEKLADKSLSAQEMETLRADVDAAITESESQTGDVE